MRWIGSAVQVVHVAGEALVVRGEEVAVESSGVAAVTSSYRMRALQREACSVVTFDHALCPPGLFAMAGAAVVSEFTVVGVLVAADASLGLEDRHGPAVVVAAQALGAVVGALELDSCSEFMVELEVLGERGPVLAYVAESTVPGKGVMGQDGPKACPPAIAFASLQIRRDASYYDESSEPQDDSASLAQLYGHEKTSETLVHVEADGPGSIIIEDE
jgi:hypothetical protein